jgi:hypothetical protein
MRPPLWPPPVALSTAEHALIKRIRRAKLFVFLRQHRHPWFSDPFQEALAMLYKDQPQGHLPVPPRHWLWRRSCKPPRVWLMTQ